MTKKVEPAQAELLSELESAREVLLDLRRQEDEAKDKVWELVTKGFEMDISGVKLSRACGLSQSRTYQIRDEADAQAQAV